MKKIIILIAVLITTKSFSDQILLECTDLGEGNITKVDITQNQLTEFFDDDSTDSRKVKDKEWEKKSFKLSSYYGYSRTLKLDENGQWVLAWGCGESFPVTCKEAP